MHYNGQSFSTNRKQKLTNISLPRMFCCHEFKPDVDCFKIQGVSTHKRISKNHFDLRDGRFWLGAITLNVRKPRKGQFCGWWPFENYLMFWYYFVWMLYVDEMIWNEEFRLKIHNILNYSNNSKIKQKDRNYNNSKIKQKDRNYSNIEYKRICC